MVSVDGFIEGLAELSRELDISRSVIRNWKRFAEAGATTAVQASYEAGVARFQCEGCGRDHLLPFSCK